MINILLICSGGMSTSFLAKRMQESANKKGIETSILAVGDSSNILASYDHDSFNASTKADIILIGPQIRYLEENIKARVNNEIPVSVIDMRAYGTMNGELILSSALKILEEYNSITNKNY